MSSKISQRTLIELGDITGNEPIPLGVAGDLAITPDLLADWIDLITGDFWPLGGTADLDNDTTITGGNFNLNLGTSGSRINAFNLLTDNTQTFEVDDGVDDSSLVISANGIDVEANVGTPNSEGITHTTNGLFDVYSLSCDFIITGNWSVQTAAALFHALSDDIDFFSDSGNIHFVAFNEINFESSDGADTSTLQLVPDAISFVSGEFAVTNQASLFLGLSGVELYFYDPDLNQAIISMAEDGVLSIGGLTVGVSADDINIAATNIIEFDSNATVFIGTRSDQENAVSQLTGSLNNYATSGSFIFLTSDAAWNITGLVPDVADGDEKGFYNGGSFDITFLHQSLSSTDINRIINPGGGDFPLTPGKFVTYKYSNTLNRWILKSFT